MSLPTTKTRLGIHAAVRAVEIFLLYGHFIGATVFAGDVLKKTVPSLTFHAALFAIPVYIVAIVLIASFAIVLVQEFKNAGLPRARDPTALFRINRVVLRVTIIAGIAVCFCTFVFYLVVSVYANLQVLSASAGVRPLFAVLGAVLVSWLMLCVLTLLHLDWLRRVAAAENSAFATVPAMIRHLLPNQGIAEDLKAVVRRDARSRIVQLWLGGFNCVVLGVSYVHAFFPNLTSNTNLLAQFVVGAVFWIWISVSLTVFLITASKREIGIIDGTYTAVGRSRLLAVYFGVVLSAGLLLALACLGANLFRAVAVLVIEQMTTVIFSVLLVAWAPILFYAALCMDILIIHVRNKSEDQSVCCRLPIPLTMGSNYAQVVTDESLAYDADF